MDRALGQKFQCADLYLSHGTGLVQDHVIQWL
jgi:hypothetical protein